MANNKEYQRGYRAGVRRGKQIPDRMSEDQFYDEVLLRVMPYAMECSGWTIGEKQISSTTDRVHLAHCWAKEAVRKRRIGQ